MKNKILVTILTTILIISLSGCSKENDSKQDELTKVTVMLDWTPNTNHTGLYVAIDQGYYKDLGLDVEIIEASEAGPEAAVADGSVDFGISFQDYLVPAFSAKSENQLPLTVIGTIIQHNTSGIVSLKDKGIESPADMSGHNYATWSLPIEQNIIKQVVTNDGGNYDDIELIPTYVENIVAALSSDIDSVWIYYAWDGIATEVNELDTNFFYFKDYAPELDYYNPVIISNNDFLEDNPETAKAFMEATSKGYEYAMQNPSEAANILVSMNEGLDAKICEASQIWLAEQYQAEATQWGYIDQARWDAFYQWVYDNGLCDYEIPEGYGFTNEFLPDN